MDFIIEAGGRGNIDMIRSTDNKVFAENLSSDNNYAELVETLKAFSRGTYMKNLELTDPRYNVVFEFIPVRYEVLADDSYKVTDTLKIEDISDNGRMFFKESDQIAILIKASHIGTNDAYFSVIDIQPDGGINGILPAEDPTLKQNPEDFRIKAGQSFIVPGSFVTFQAPYGMEVFKLFASKEPIDFTPILTKKPRMRDIEYQLETLFREGYSQANRGGITQKVRSSGMEASTSYIGFEIRR